MHVGLRTLLPGKHVVLATVDHVRLTRSACIKVAAVRRKSCGVHIPVLDRW
jgi:hypothetical protein